MPKRTLAAEVAANRKRNRKTADGHALSLRLDVALLMIRILKEGEVTAQRLAEATDYTWAQIDSILDADFNLSTEDIGLLAHALGVEFRLGAASLSDGD